MEQEKTQYTEEKLDRYERRGAKIADKEWLQSKNGRLIIPENVQWKILKGLYESFHLGVESAYHMASSLFKSKNVMKNLNNIIKRCEACQNNNNNNNPKTEKLAKSGLQ